MYKVTSNSNWCYNVLAANVKTCLIKLQECCYIIWISFVISYISVRFKFWYRAPWIQHVNRMPRNRLPRVMKHYFPTGRRNYGRPLKRLLDTWDRNGSTSGPTPWHIYDDDDDDYDDDDDRAHWGWRDAETWRSAKRLHLYISKVHLIVSTMNGLTEMNIPVTVRKELSI